MSISPRNKGWVNKYFSLIENYEDVLNRFPGTILNAEELVYAFLQPTGLLYGHPTSFVFLDDEFLSKFTADESFRVLLLEGLVLVDHLKSGKFDHGELEESLGRFVDFYEKTNLEKAKKGWLNFSKLDVYGKIESIISKRVEIKGSMANKLVTTYLYNSLLFHDLLLYQDYLANKNTDDITEKRSEIMLDLVKIIALAANADGQISDEEKGVFKVFLASANLDSDRRVIAESFFDDNKTLNDMDFKFENSWLLKRFILEIAILTIWSDKGVADSEQIFLNDLTIKLGLKEEDKDKSYIAIQSFVLNNQDNALFLKGRNDVELILTGATKRWTKILGRNKDKLADELKQSKELVSLISKSTVRDLNKEEKEQVRSQFYDLAKTIPSLALFMLPGGAIILPIVLKIIPNLIPSAFQNNRIEDKKSEEEE
tara:strand:- start:98 stop:1378 length:1281 start_codon:yes stop_codon:yes gene_type:complete